MAVETTPKGFPTIPIMATNERDALFSFLERVFEATLLDRYESSGGGPAYMTIRLGDSVIAVMRPVDGPPTRSAFYIYVRDVVVYRNAVEAGARSLQEPVLAPHGDRMATVMNPFDNQWTIASRIEEVSVEELHQRLADLELE